MTKQTFAIINAVAGIVMGIAVLLEWPTMPKELYAALFFMIGFFVAHIAYEWFATPQRLR